MNENKFKKIHDDIIDSILPAEMKTDEIKKSQEEFLILRSELSKESDRGCVLLATSHLDFMLEQMFRKKMIGNKKHLDSLLDFNGALGTFSSKISMAYSIGLFPKLAMQDIEKIRKIRNQFAHTTKIISFDDPSIKKICNEFNYNIKDESSARLKFISSVSSLSGVIEGQIHSSKEFSECKDVDLEKRKETYKLILDMIKEAAQS